MANPVPAAAPLVQQQPVVPVEEQIGNLNEREVSILRTLCRDKDDENGAVIGRILWVASLVASVFAALAVGAGVSGFILGLATYIVLGNLLSQTYHGLRNHDYLEAGQALHTRSFKEYIVQHEVVPTIDNIVMIHAQYKKFAAQQALQLQPAPQQA